MFIALQPSKKVLNSQGSSIILTDGEQALARELTRLSHAFIEEIKARGEPDPDKPPGLKPMRLADANSLT